MTSKRFSRRTVLSGTAALSAAAILPRSSLGAATGGRPRRCGSSCRRRRRLDRRDGPAAGGASAADLGPIGDRGEPFRRRRHHRHLEVARAKGDGHTILIGNPGPNAIALSIFKNLTYKADQLRSVSNMIRIPNIVSAHPSTGIKSIPELIDYLEEEPRQAHLRFIGHGAEPHLTGAWFLQLTGLKMTQCRSAAPARR